MKSYAVASLEGYTECPVKPDHEIARERMIEWFGILVGLENSAVSTVQERHSAIEMIYHWGEKAGINPSLASANGLVY